MDAFLPIWNAFLVHPLLSLLVGAFDVAQDFGLAVVLVTIAIRLVLFPLYVTMIRSQRVMQELAPAMNELKQKYGKDRQKLSEEQMKLYKERGYNPLSGCLPLVLQMPILFAMYAAFIQAPHFTGTELGNILLPFIPNPLGPDGTIDMSAHWLPWINGCNDVHAGSNPGACGLAREDPLHILPVLAGVTQLIASVMAQPAKRVVSDDPQAKMMQSMTYYYPAITIFIAWGFASGLAIYWITSTLFQIVQQYFVSGWGQLPRFVPLLKNIPTPADSGMQRREAAAVDEVERDMGGRAAIAQSTPSNPRPRDKQRRKR